MHAAQRHQHPENATLTIMYNQPAKHPTLCGAARWPPTAPSAHSHQSAYRDVPADGTADISCPPYRPHKLPHTEEPPAPTNMRHVAFRRVARAPLTCPSVMQRTVVTSLRPPVTTSTLPAVRASQTTPYLQAHVTLPCQPATHHGQPH
jgi:hypothetical protein